MLGGDCRLSAADALRRLSDDVYGVDAPQRLLARAAAHTMDVGGRQVAIELLRRVAESPLMEGQADAIEELAKLGGDHRAHAARLYHRLASMPTDDWNLRQLATEELAALDPRHRGLAIAALTTLANEVTAPNGIRIQAVDELAVLGAGPRAIADQVLRSIATASTAELDDRLRAATGWAKLGDAQRDEALARFGARLADPTTAPSDQILAGAVLIALDPDNHPLAASTLARIAACPSVEDKARLLAAQAITELGDDTLESAMTTVASIADDPAKEVTIRISAVQRLINSGSTHRDIGIGALRSLAADHSIDDPGIWASSVKRGDLLRRAASPIGPGLEKILIDATQNPTINPVYRYLAAERTIGADTEKTARTAEILFEIALDYTAGSLARLYSAEVLLKRMDGWSERVTPVLEELTADVRNDEYVRARSTKALAVSGTDGRSRAAVALRRYAITGAPRGHAARMAMSQADVIAGGNAASLIAAAGALAADPFAGWEERVTAAQTAGKLSPDCLDRVIETYRDAEAAPTALPWERAQAAAELAKLEAPDRMRATSIHRRIALDPYVHPEQRRSSAASWARLDPESRNRVIDCLYGMAVQPEAPVDQRIRAALDLALHDEASTISALTAIASDPQLPVLNRVEAAGWLTRFSDKQTTALAADADMAMLDYWASTQDRVAAVSLSSRVRSESWSISAVVLAGLFSVADAPDRPAIAELLLGFGPRMRPTAVDALASIASDPAQDDTVRLKAARRWGQLGAAERRRAVEALSTLARDSTVGAKTRIDAAEALARLDPGRRQEAIGLLLELSTAVATRAEHRMAALVVLIRLRPRLERDEPIALLLAISADPSASPDTRWSAAAEASRLGPKAEQSARMILREAAGNACLTPLQQQEATQKAQSVRRRRSHHRRGASGLKDQRLRRCRRHGRGHGQGRLSPGRCRHRRPCSAGASDVGAPYRCDGPDRVSQAPTARPDHPPQLGRRPVHPQRRPVGNDGRRCCSELRSALLGRLGSSALPTCHPWSGS